jgi:carbon starvation protein
MQNLAPIVGTPALSFDTDGTSWFERTSDRLDLWLTTGGTGGLTLWPLFGATNQLLAGLAFIVITAWLIARRKPIWFIIPPAIIMLIIPAAAMFWQAYIGNDDNHSWLKDRNWLLVSIATLTLALEAWLITETAIRWRTKRPLNELQTN